MKIVETRVYGHLIIIADYILLGFMWITCSLPILTIVPASVASLYVIAQWKKGTSQGLLLTFFRGMKRNLFSNLLLNLLTLSIVVIMKVMIREGSQLFGVVCFGSLIIYGIFLLSWMSNCVIYSNRTAKKMFMKSAADVIFHFGETSVALLLVGMFSLFVSVFPLALFLFAGGFWKLVSLLIVKVGK
ncbi:hypothetical protein IGI37_002061 [Enterococcus sp. AZ194]|uniref:DUF624 domain-containing protein n=1 Tax=Enterococcus sp. AZ194 TaxID=2774629 RepID=UPI003F1F8954